MQIDLHSYDHYLVAFSGGKDSIACLLYLINAGVPAEKIELWHHLVDGREKENFFDWEVTESYCQKLADAFGVRIYFSWKEGGFLREMYRENSLTAPIVFETPEGIKKVGGERGKKSTRRKFPQVSADLKVRWCSSYLKIDVMSAAIRNQDRFNGKRTLVISGERGEESPARAKYQAFEKDRSDLRDGKVQRLVDRFRPVKDWTENMVWTIIEHFRVVAHPAYYLGFGRCSCKFCIFANANQTASAFAVSPEIGDKIAGIEVDFCSTIKRKESIKELAAKGTAYESMTEEMVAIATATEYTGEIFTADWVLPAGAYGESCGPL